MAPANRRAVRVSEVVVGAVLAVVLLAVVLEGVLDYFAISLDAGTVAQTFIDRPQLAAVPLVGIEEAGVPLPISGDLLIMYSASGVGPNPYAWLALGLAFEGAVLVGSSSLFMVSRRWGARFLRGPLGATLHLTPARFERAHRWITRWGIWAVMFGRWVPGFRVAVTVVAASFGLHYRVFITGVAISAAVWIALFMTLGLLVGTAAERLLAAHQNASLLAVAAVVVGASLYVAAHLAWRRRGTAIS
jgi:membrane protein DedA with SNARE-associated domain